MRNDAGMVRQENEIDGIQIESRANQASRGSGQSEPVASYQCDNTQRNHHEFRNDYRIKIPTAGCRNARYEKIYNNVVGQTRTEEHVAAGKNGQFAAENPYGSSSPTPDHHSSAKQQKAKRGGARDQFEDAVHPTAYDGKAPSTYPNMRERKLIERDYPIHFARGG